jgi:hypothetical protein
MMGYSFKNPVKSIGKAVGGIAKNPLNPKGYVDTGLATVTGGQVTTDDFTGEEKAAIEAKRKADKERSAADASALTKGEEHGYALAKDAYGQDLKSTGQDISRIRDLQKQRTMQSGGDPVSAAIMGQKQGAMANAQRGLAASGVKGGAAAGAIANVERQQNQDIAASLYGQQRQSIADERILAGNTIAGTVALGQGEKGMANASRMPASVETGGMGVAGTVICTELHRQGIMSDELYAKEVEFGKTVDPIVMLGYTFLATPIVKIMQKSKLCTTLCSYPAMAWARDMAGDENILGSLLFMFGVPLCYFVGKLKLSFSGAKYV